MVTISLEPMPGITISEIQQIRKGDCIIIQKYCQLLEPIIQRTAIHFAKKATNHFDELVQEGRLAAVKAVNFWCPDIGQLLPYVVRSVRNAMLYICRSEQRRRTHLILDSEMLRPEFECRTLIEDMATEGDWKQVEDRDAMPVLKQAVASWLEQLPSKKRKMVELIYFHGRNQSQAAKELGITRARAGQIIQEVIALGKISLAHVAHVN